MTWSRLSVYGLALAVSGAAPIGAVTAAGAQAESYNLVCQGPLHQDDQQRYAFRWAATGAAQHVPRRGECSWYDRAGRGSEVDEHGGNVFCSAGTTPDLGQVRDGQFVHVAARRDEAGSPANCIAEERDFGFVFTSSATPGPDN